MSSPVSSEHVARIRDDARRLLARAGDHEYCLEGLVRAAETDIRDAEAALAEARNGARTDAGELQRACSAHLRRSRESVDVARQARVSAREQHVAARRLLSRLGDERPVEQTGPHGRAAAVLVVDDVEDVREVVAHVLREAGFIVRTAVNGLDALIAAYEMQPAVIVMDMTMPVLDGIEATRLIKAAEATRDARVIAYTGNPSLADVLVQRLFAAVVRKPSTPDVVVAAVQNVANL